MSPSGNCAVSGPYQPLEMPARLLFTLLILLHRAASPLVIRGRSRPSNVYMHRRDAARTALWSKKEKFADAEFPAPLTPVDRALRASKFWSAAVPG